MSGASRKGLKRHGLRSYIVSGGGWAFIIRRDRPGRWLVRNAKFEDLSWDFFAVLFHTLHDARAWAEKQLWPYPNKYKNTVRRNPRRVLRALHDARIAEERGS